MGVGDALQSWEHSSSVNSVAWNSDGTLLASGSGNGTVWIWDPTSVGIQD